MVDISKLESLYDCLYSIIEYHLVYDAIVKNYETPEMDKRQFLIYCSDSCLQMSYMLWTKVFGGEKNNKLHWEKYVERSLFFDKLKIDYGIEENDFERYVEEVKCFRDKFIAHSDNYIRVIPGFDIARKAVIILDELLYDENIPFGSLKDYCAVSTEKYNAVVKSLL